MKNCLLMGYFGHHNLGDDLLYKESIERMPRDFRVYVLSDGQYTSDLLDDRVELIKSFKDILKRNYELSIVNGGGQYPTLGFGKKELMLKFLIRLRSKLMVINGVGIVPKKGFWNNKRFATYLRMLDYISVRDNVSKHYVDRLLGGGRCVNCHDLYFAKGLDSLKGNRNGVLVCMANPFTKQEMQETHYITRYKALIQTIQSLLKRMKADFEKITFMPFFLGSDEKIISDIMQDGELSDSNVLTPYKDFTLDEVDSIFASYKIGLCMRFHSFVLATRNALPFVGICYDYKSESLLNEMDLSNVGLRYGIRSSQFFGCEKDIEFDDLNHIYEYVRNNLSYIENKLNYYGFAFHKDVLTNYQSIFKLLK